MKKATMVRRRLRGISYVEITLALFLMTASATIVAVTMPISTISRGKADLFNKAQNLAQKQLERVKAAGYPNLTGTQLNNLGIVDSATPTTGTTFSWTDSDSGVSHSPGTVLPSGTATLTIDQVDTDLRRVTLTVNYSDRGRALTYSVGTLIANL